LWLKASFEIKTIQEECPEVRATDSKRLDIKLQIGQKV
jgi:hypothetical protein